MQLFLKIAIFALINLIALFIMPVMVVLPVKFGIFPELTDELIDKFWKVLALGGFFGWGTTALISLRYFFVQGTQRFIYLTLPLCYTSLFVTSVLVYFTAIAK